MGKLMLKLKLTLGTTIMASGITAMDMATMATVLMDIESMEREKLSPLLKLMLKLKLTPGTAIMATMDTMVTTVPMDTMDTKSLWISRTTYRDNARNMILLGPKPVLVLSNIWDSLIG